MGLVVCCESCPVMFGGAMVVVWLVWYGFLGWFTVFFYLNGGGSLCFARFMVVGLGGFFYFFFFFFKVVLVDVGLCL